MSKDKLEEMENDYKNGFPINIEWLIEYAKEQAERVPELESHLSKNGNKYRNQNKKLRKELDRVTRQRNKQQGKAILNQMTINLEDHKKEIRERTIEGYKNLKNKQRERIEELEDENKRYRESMQKAIDLSAWGNDESANIIMEALEANK